MNFQIPLLVIVRRSVSIITASFTNRRETHLRIRRCLSSYGIMRKRPDVVRSLGWDPGYHEVIRNGPENRIHIRKVPFSEFGNDSGVFIGNVLEGSGMSGTPEGKGYMNVSLQVGMIASCTKCI